MREATTVPLEVLERSTALGARLSELASSSPAKFASDVTTARALAEAACKGARANVDINLAYLPEDGFRASVSARLAALKTLVLATVLCLALPLFGQYPIDYDYGTQRKTDPSLNSLPAPTFRGTVDAIDKKLLVLEGAAPNALTFKITKKTVFLKGNQKVKLQDIPTGAPVSVEAHKAPDGSLAALAVHLERKK